MPASSSTKPPPLPQATTQPNTKQIPIKAREPGKCWGYQEPWTSEHKFLCKFRRAVNVMSLNPEEWLAVEQSMEEENHVLLQAKTTKNPNETQHQLLIILAHAAKGTTSTTTLSLLVHIGSSTGVALVDSGNTDSFLDYTFAGKSRCSITSCNPLKVKVAEGGFLDTCAITVPTNYCIQQQ
jgi:hypothetical protein